MRYLEHSPFLEEAFKPFAESYKNLKRLSLEEQEILYGVSFGFYDSGQYEKAVGFFTQLVLSNPFNVSFWKGLASAEQMKQNYRAALHAWAIVCILDDTTPLPHFHAAENYFQMGENGEGLKALSCAEKLLKKEDSALKEKIMLLKETIASKGRYK